MELQKELVGLLEEVKFNLRKCSSNCTTLMDFVPMGEKKVETLCSLWDPDSDQFSTWPTLRKHSRMLQHTPKVPFCTVKLQQRRKHFSR